MPQCDLRKIYVAGPMTGLPDFNRPAFFAYAAQLGEEGHIVLNPATLPLGLAHSEYMELCRPMVALADEIHMLPGWVSSRGALVEHEWATMAGKTIRYVGVPA
ncbi:MULTISPECIES: DUF4406 domain-containing protein [Aeromonas]|uniref:DUF4406 domain-containing protein n=1 Tax=Aeromonas TaxID=642 RepID=UPI00080A9A09|nr:MULTISPECIES: DUF4406 domain-containing protein [Aeromonas]ANT70242.1 nucleoside 2-deoxyribosyltransferase family protein [Aeromonas hydrophila]MDH0348185.1 DUF4406 domain-containing protein [Aeromonas dhakensis]